MNVPGNSQFTLMPDFSQTVR